MDLPPQVMKDQVRSLAARHDAELMDRGLGSSGLGRWPHTRGGQTLPVLQAFHEFLEVERRHTRTRMLVLTGIFLFLLLCIAGAGILAVVYLSRSMNSELIALRAQMKDEERQSAALHTDTGGKMVAISGDAAELHKQVVGAQAEMVTLRKELAAGTSGQTEKLAKLHKLLAAVEQQNTALASDLKSIHARLQTGPALLPSPISPRSEEPEETSPPSDYAAPSPPEDGTPSARERWIRVAVMPPDAKEPIPLLLPIPE